MLRTSILLVCLCAVSGCALFGGEKEGKVEDWSADKLYTEAKEAIKNKYFTRAIEYYEQLETRYPFGKHSQQAQLDLAYAYYKTEEPAAAIAACNRFIKLNPTHRNVDYAYYLRGLANFNRSFGFTQRFLPHDPTQRDPGASLRSFEDFTLLLRRFPSSQYAADAQKRMVYLRNNLAQHEVNVANYYMRRSAYVAAANRARYVVENYQKSPAMPDALTLMIRAYRVLEMDDLAADTLRVLEMNYPEHPGLKEAKTIRVN